MYIRIGYDISYRFPAPTEMIMMLHTHPSLSASLHTPERLFSEPFLDIEDFIDLYGNRCARASCVSAWFEAFLGDQWHTFDARNNRPRVGRILMARGRDAADTALTTTFGRHVLENFTIWTYEISEEQARQGL
jgi:transglutaminase-like putative cysteine protease